MAPLANDRNLLFGILALQMDFVSRDDLVAGMNAWVLAKNRPLGDVLVDRRALDPADRTLLDAMVDRHLARHGGNTTRSLAALARHGAGPGEALAAVDDDGVRASLTAVALFAGQTPAALTDAPISSWDSVPPSPVMSATAGGTGRPPAAPGGRFRVLRPHARGGLGEVFVARDEELGREVALKEIRTERSGFPEARLRFLREAEINGNLEHPGIVPVYGMGAHPDGRPYYAMRFVRGESLKEAVERFHRPNGDDRSLELRKLLRRFVDVCNAIEYAHSRNIIHRDIKPANVMLGPFGETLVVDWGLARASGEVVPAGPPAPGASGSQELTVAGVPQGTPAYMSPEQADGRLDQVGPASDVYGLGATLFSVLTGRSPVEASTSDEAMTKVRRGDLVAARSVRPDVPRPLEAVCRKAMALRPADRYPSARAGRGRRAAGWPTSPSRATEMNGPYAPGGGSAGTTPRRQPWPRPPPWGSRSSASPTHARRCSTPS
ncbi:MAG: serine/threonine-protein kinase [Isosphaeraceae bacterium]